MVCVVQPYRKLFVNAQSCLHWVRFHKIGNCEFLLYKKAPCWMLFPYCLSLPLPSSLLPKTSPLFCIIVCLCVTSGMVNLVNGKTRNYTGECTNTLGLYGKDTESVAILFSTKCNETHICSQTISSDCQHRRIRFVAEFEPISCIVHKWLGTVLMG